MPSALACRTGLQSSPRCADAPRTRGENASRDGENERRALMTLTRREEQKKSPRVLLFSGRNIFEREVWRCSFQEFERIVQEIDAVELVAPVPHRWYAQGKRAALRIGQHLKLPFNPGIPSIELDRDYDLFFAVVEKPSELLHLKAVKGWRERCKTSICWLTEFYVRQMPIYKSALEVLAEFDHVIFMFNTSESFKKVINGQSHYLAAGVDTLRFCPYPDPPQRCIDVLSIGRRSKVTHRALLNLAREHRMFYVYDTINDLHAYNLDEHRSLMTNMAKRSRYFIVNPGKINDPAETGGQSEFGYRYFEAAAPGTIMLGERPKNNKEFDRIFHWQDAVIDVPFDYAEIGAVIHELDGQPERQMNIRRTNITQCLLHHDWVHRWEAILQIAGMEALPVAAQRKRVVKDLSTRVQDALDEPQEPEKR